MDLTPAGPTYGPPRMDPGAAGPMYGPPRMDPAAAGPMYGPPRPSAFVLMWPDRGHAPTTAVLAVAAAAAALGAATAGARPGLALALAGTAVAATAVRALPGGPGRLRTLGAYRTVAGLLALALLWVVVVRDAPWLVTLCLLGVVGCASLALTGARTATGAVLSAVTVPMAAVRAVPWLARAVPRRERERDRVPAVRAVAAAAVVFVGFTALLSGADVVFAAGVGRLLPDLGDPEAVGRVVAALLAGGLALACGYIASAPPRWDTAAPGPGRPARRLEWAMPVLVLDGLLAVFLITQLVAALGGADAVLREEGVTYAAYAREGFAYLIVVSVLVLLVLAAAGRYAAPDGPDGRLARWTLGTACLLAVGVAVSALHRLSLYEQEFGLTRARLSAAVFAFWIAVVLLLAVVWFVLQRGGWIVSAVLLSAGVVLLGLAVSDPDAVIARRDVDRFIRTGDIDPAYLASLSADAVPAVDRLPEPLRSCLLRDLTPDPGGWASANASRDSARDLLERRPTADLRATECFRVTGPYD